MDAGRSGPWRNLGGVHRLARLWDAPPGTSLSKRPGMHRVSLLAWPLVGLGFFLMADGYWQERDPVLTVMLSAALASLGLAWWNGRCSSRDACVALAGGRGPVTSIFGDLSRALAQPLGDCGGRFPNRLDVVHGSWRCPCWRNLRQHTRR